MTETGRALSIHRCVVSDPNRSLATTLEDKKKADTRLRICTRLPVQIQPVLVDPNVAVTAWLEESDAKNSAAKLLYDCGTRLRRYLLALARLKLHALIPWLTPYLRYSQDD